MKIPNILVGFSGNPQRHIKAGAASPCGKRPVQSDWLTVGGTSVNMARQLQALGISVHLIVTVGQDVDAVIIEEELSRYPRAVPHSLIACREENSFAWILFQGGQREVFSRKGKYVPSMIKDAALRVREIARSEDPRIVVASGCMPDEEKLILELFSQPDCLRVLNPRSELCEANDALLRLLRETDVLCLNENELAAFLNGKPVWREDIRWLHGMGPATVIVTRGKRGAIISVSGGEYFEVAPRSFGEEIDATGAGDFFLSGFLYSLINSWSLRQCGEFASLVAGLAATTGRDGHGALTRSEIEKHGGVSCDLTGFFRAQIEEQEKGKKEATA